MRKTTYEEIDKILFPWAEKYGLHIYTQAKENIEVRDTIIVDDAGKSHHLWVTPECSRKITVGIAEGGRPSRLTRIERYEASLDELEYLLEKGYLQIAHWIKEKR